MNENDHDHDYFNFTLAEDEFGFDFVSFSNDGFRTFLRESYIHEFILFRKSYIACNYFLVKFHAHKFKGSFAYDIK